MEVSFIIAVISLLKYCSRLGLNFSLVLSACVRCVSGAVMTGRVMPSAGFGGQKFIESQVNKTRRLKELCNERGVNPWIEIDGGVTPANAYKLIEAGANALVAGSAVYGAKDYAEGKIYSIDSFLCQFRDIILLLAQSERPTEVL